MSSEELERIYRVFIFPEDPFSEEGRARYERALEEFNKIIEHTWVKNIMDTRDKVHVLDLCGGTGIGGVALAKKIIEAGKNVELTIVDLRGSALEKAKEFCRRELGFEPRTVVWDARKVHELGLKVDLMLMYGLATPHFCPWDLLRVYASASLAISDDGVFIVEESDRFQTIFRRVGYKDILAEHVSEDRIVLTLHKSHDILTGYTTRVAVDLVTKQASPMNVYFWDIASSATLLWIFFNDIDFIQKPAKPSGYIIAYKPRKTITPQSFISCLPKILQNK
ncbi:class I SAM-dependent methyltransferase [Desulfurococcaceae archaeon MEX13E-LK6-19]|nr:class I SAM-dependent methyltransferase [Desulfurococcaceae archaeon MEX13E-LK6-19]